MAVSPMKNMQTYRINLTGTHRISLNIVDHIHLRTYPKNIQKHNLRSFHITMQNHHFIDKIIICSICCSWISFFSMAKSYTTGQARAIPTMSPFLVNSVTSPRLGASPPQRLGQSFSASCDGRGTAWTNLTRSIRAAMTRRRPFWWIFTETKIEVLPSGNLT